MAISTKLEMRQSQSLIMTPQLMQAIKLLQMSNLDLVAYVEAELERNPLLERTENGDGSGAADGQGGDHDGAHDASGGDDFEAGGGEFSSSDGAPSEWLKSDLEPQAEAIASQMDTDLGNVFPDEPGVSAAPEPASLLGIDSHRASSSASSEDYNLEAFVAEEESLIQVLMDQMHLAFADPVDKIIGQHLINSLDENGYLHLDLEETAAQLGIPAARIEAVLAVMQGFEPSGVFARSLAECLALQLKERNRFDPAMEAMIAHIELLARHDYPALRRICGVDEEDLADMIAEIKALDPRPGRAYGSSIVQPMVPDVLVRPASDGAGRWN